MGIRGPAKQNSNIEHLKKPTVEHIADCEDCGAKSVRNRRVLHHLNSTPFTHWRSKCNCGRYRHPITNQWLDCSAYNLSRCSLMSEETRKRTKKTELDK